MNEFTVTTTRHTQFIEINAQVQEVVDKSGLKDGLCTVFVPHTTAGVTINENADPDVAADMIGALDKIVPWKSPAYKHAEGNSAAHVKSSLMGHSVHVPVQNSQLQFGTWQGIFLCEFDGPRSRTIQVMVR